MGICIIYIFKFVKKTRDIMYQVRLRCLLMRLNVTVNNLEALTGDRFQTLY